eukprot:6198293-Prymnesium_polylepis.1
MQAPQQREETARGRAPPLASRSPLDNLSTLREHDGLLGHAPHQHPLRAALAEQGAVHDPPLHPLPGRPALETRLVL